jgi:hypothetical protein
MSATLRLNRSTFGWELRRGTFDIVVDGDKIGALESNETVELPVGSGRHTLCIRKGRYSSREQSFEASDGEIVNFRLHGVTIWPLYLASAVKRDLAIRLRRE